MRQDRLREPPRERHIVRHPNDVISQYGFQYGAEDLETDPLAFSRRRGQLRARNVVFRPDGRDSGGNQRLDWKIAAVVCQPDGTKPPYREGSRL